MDKETGLDLIERINQMKSYLNENNIEHHEIDYDNIQIDDIKCSIDKPENKEFEQQVFTNVSFRKISFNSNNNNIHYINTYNNKYNVIMTIKSYKYKDNVNDIHNKNNNDAAISMILSTLINKTRHIQIPLLCFDTKFSSLVNILKNEPKIYKCLDKQIKEKEIKNIFFIHIKEYFHDGDFLCNINTIDYKILIFQILYTLAQIQKVYPNFKHNNLTPTNIFIYQYDIPKNVVYNINNLHFEFETNFDVKITNFDKAEIDSNEPNKTYDIRKLFKHLLNDIKKLSNTKINEIKLFLKHVIDNLDKNNENKKLTPIKLLEYDFFSSFAHQSDTEYETDTDTDTDTDTSIQQDGGAKKYYTQEERKQYEEKKKKKFGDDYNPNFRKEKYYTDNNGPVSKEIPNINEENPFQPGYINEQQNKKDQELKDKEKQKYREKQKKERESKKDSNPFIRRNEEHEIDSDSDSNPFSSFESKNVNKNIRKDKRRKKEKMPYDVSHDDGKIQPYKPKLHDETSETRDDRYNNNKYSNKPYSIKTNDKQNNTIKPYKPQQYISDNEENIDSDLSETSNISTNSQFDKKNKEYREKYKSKPYETDEFSKHKKNKYHEQNEKLHIPDKDKFDKTHKSKYSTKPYKPKYSKDNLTDKYDKDYNSDEINKLQDLDKEDRTRDIIDYYYHPYQAHTLHPNYMLMNKLNTAFSVNNPNLKIPMQNIYNIKLTNTARDLEFLERVYEDMIPVQFDKFDYKTVQERHQLLQYFRNRILDHGDGEEISLVAGAPKSYLQRLMLLEIAPYHNRMDKNIKNKYSDLPLNFINYNAAGPIRYDRMNGSVKLAADKVVGFNIRQYGLSVGALLANQLNNSTNHLYFDEWRDIKYYQHILQNVTKRKVSPNFINLILYSLDKTIKFDYDKLESIIKEKKPTSMFFNENKHQKEKDLNDIIVALKTIFIPSLYSNLDNNLKKEIANKLATLRTLNNNNFKTDIIDELFIIFDNLISSATSLNKDEQDKLNKLKENLKTKVELYENFNFIEKNKILELDNNIKKDYSDIINIINNTKIFTKDQKDLFKNLLNTIEQLSSNINNRKDDDLTKQSGVSLIALTEAPTYSFEQWVTPKDNKLGERYTQITTGYHTPEVMKSIIFQMVYTFIVLYKCGFLFPDISLKNFFIKELYYKGTPSSHWTFVIDDIEYFIPNYGYLLLFDSTYGDRETDNEYKDNVPSSSTETTHTIYYKDDTTSSPSPPSSPPSFKYTQKKYESSKYFKILSKENDNKIYPDNTSIKNDDYKNNFINKMMEFFSFNNFQTGFMTNALYDEDLRNLIINIETQLNEILKDILSISSTTPEKKLDDLIINVFSCYINDRVGTNLTKNEFETMYSPIRNDKYKKGELLIYMERYQVYKWVVYVGDDSVDKQIKVIDKQCSEIKEINKNRVYRKRANLPVNQTNEIFSLDKCLERYDLGNLIE